MATAKKKKGKYVKKNHEFWAMRSRKKNDAKPAEAEAAIATKPVLDNKGLTQIVLNGYDMLSKGDKARVFAHILGKSEIRENHLWIIKKLIED